MTLIADQPRDTVGRFDEKPHSAPESELADPRVGALVDTIRDMVDGSAAGYGLTFDEGALDVAMAGLERSLTAAAR